MPKIQVFRHPWYSKYPVRRCACTWGNIHFLWYAVQFNALGSKTRWIELASVRRHGTWVDRRASASAGSVDHIAHVIARCSCKKTHIAFRVRHTGVAIRSHYSLGWCCTTAIDVVKNAHFELRSVSCGNDRSVWKVWTVKLMNTSSSIGQCCYYPGKDDEKQRVLHFLGIDGFWYGRITGA